MTIVPIHLADGRSVEGERILEEILTQLAESVPGTAGLTKMDLHARKLFAHGLLPMVYSGEVPSQDKEGALASLRERPTEAFDFHNEGAAIAQWTKSQFEVLSPRLASVLAKASGASTRDTSYWITQLFEFAIRTPNEPSRTGDLMDTVFGPESRFRSGAGFLDGLGSFLNLITLVEPAVLVLDEVDGLSSDSDSALRATSTLISLWESAPRMSVIISVNDDVWESAFAPRLPLGLRDRLEDVVIRLKPLTVEEARDLVKSRAGDEAEKVLGVLDLGSVTFYPRGVLKAARDAWNQSHIGEEASPKEDSALSSALGKAPLRDLSEAPSTNFTEEPLKDLSDVALRDFSTPPASQATPEVEEPSASVTPPPPKVNYPPLVVRRVAIPRSFDVQRIRETAPVASDFAAPAVTQPPAFQESPAPVESAPVQATPFESAPAETQPVQVSPFEVSPAQTASVESAPVQEAPPASPFLVAGRSASKPQSVLPPVRASLPSPSPFELTQAPDLAPESTPAFQQATSPFGAEQGPEGRRSGRTFPSNSPFDPAPAQPVQTPPVFAAPPAFSAPPAAPEVQAPSPSPFEANLAPQSVPPQPEVPKADSDAIDDLLRQFREHRDS